MSYSLYTDVQARTGLSNTQVPNATTTIHITEADAEIDLLTGRKWDNTGTTTEYLDGAKKDITDTKSTSLLLRNYPVIAVSSFLELDIDGNTVTTFTSSDYWLDSEIGKISLKELDITPGTRNYKVAYTYGTASTPQYIKTLSTLLAGIRDWIYFLGGNYNFLNNYSLPEISFGKGDFYQRGQQMINSMQEEANRLFDRVGLRARTSVFMTSGADAST